MSLVPLGDGSDRWVEDGTQDNYAPMDAVDLEPPPEPSLGRHRPRPQPTPHFEESTGHKWSGGPVVSPAILQRRPPVHPWDRQPGELDRAWSAFLVYRDLPEDIPLDGVPPVGQANISEHTGVPGSTLHLWAVKYHWQERRRLYTAYRLRLAAEQSEVTTAGRISEHQAVARQAIAKGQEIMEAVEVRTMPLKVKLDDGTVVEVQIPQVINDKSLRPAIEAIKFGVESERLSLGLPSQITRYEHELRANLTITLETQQQILIIMAEHLCDDCRAHLAEQIESISGRVDEAAGELQRLDGMDGSQFQNP